LSYFFTDNFFTFPVYIFCLDCCCADFCGFVIAFIDHPYQDKDGKDDVYNLFYSRTVVDVAIGAIKSGDGSGGDIVSGNVQQTTKVIFHPRYGVDPLLTTILQEKPELHQHRQDCNNLDIDSQDRQPCSHLNWVKRIQYVGRSSQV
jgi:hypothetical protein